MVVFNFERSPFADGVKILFIMMFIFFVNNGNSDRTCFDLCSHETGPSPPSGTAVPHQVA